MIVLAAGLIIWTCVMGTDITKTADGVRWLDTTDDWGRPWGDAASSFYRRLEICRRHLAGQGVRSDKMEFAVGTEMSLQKVFRPKVWFKGDMSGSVRIEAAGGEAESFQLVVCPIADAERKIGYLADDTTHGNGPLNEKSVEIRQIDLGPLKHAKIDYQIDSTQVSIYRVGYIRTVPCQYPVVHVGERPDLLLPFESFRVSNPNRQPV